MRDIVCVVGHGKLASRIQQDLCQAAQQANIAIQSVENWDAFSTGGNDPSRAIVVHAGSGRQFRDALAYCSAHRVPLIQASTGIAYPDGLGDETVFPLVEAPNLSIPMAKFLCLLAEMGPLFRGSATSITESHQKTKTSPPGTALEMARLLGIDASDIKSIRDEEAQRKGLGIPPEHLGQHALHVVEIRDGGCRLTLRTEVLGLATYLAGLARIIHHADTLPTGRHRLTDLIRRSLI